MNSPVELSFVILTWNSENYIDDCISSCQKKCDEEGISREIIIIDNGSTDSGKARVRMAQGADQNIHLIELDENMGTTYPRNLGLKHARGANICILDSDTEFGDGRLRGCLDRLEGDASIGILAPRLLLPDGSVQHSVKRFPTFWQKIKKIPKAVFGLQVQNDDFYGDFPFEEETAVDSAISACWFFRKELLAEIGMLDEKIFYAPEDLDFSIRSFKAGKRNVYFPNLTVLHHTQQISHKKPFSRISLSHLEGLIYYFRKHGGWFKGAR